MRRETSRRGSSTSSDLLLPTRCAHLASRLYRSALREPLWLLTTDAAATMPRERTFATAERVAAAVAARLACLHEDGAPPSSSSTAALVELYRSVAASGDDASVDGVTARARKELSKLRFALPDRSDAQLAAALALSGDWTHSAAILHLVRAHLASLTKGAANDPTDGEVAKAFTRAKAAAKKRRRDQENASGPVLVPIVEAAKLLAGR